MTQEAARRSAGEKSLVTGGHICDSSTTVTTGELLFYAYFSVMLLVKGLGFADGPVYKIGFLAGSLLALAKIYVSTYTKAEAVMVYALLALTGISFLQTRDYSVIVYGLLILSLKGIRPERAMKVGALVWTPAFLFQIGTQLLNLRTRDFVVHSKYHLGYIVRWALGYVHPNVLQVTYVVFLSYLLYCLPGRRSDRKRLARLCLLCTLGAVYIFIYSLSLTGMIGYAVFLCVLVFFEEKRRKGRAITRLESVLLQSLLPLEILVAIVAPLVLQGRAFDLLNKAETTRPQLTRTFLTEYGVGLFGSRKPSDASWTLTLDSSYAELLFYGGILIFGLMMAAYFILIRRSLREAPSWKHSVKMAVIFFCLAAAVSEPFAFNTSFKNVSLIFLGCGLFIESGGGEAEPDGFCLLWWIPAKYRQHSFVLFNPFIPIRRGLAALRRGAGCHWRRTVLTAVCAAAAAAVLYAVIMQPADAYYCRRYSADVPDGEMESLYLTEQEITELREKTGVRVLNYKDASDPMYCFTGKITEYDYLRGILSSALWAGFAAGTLTAGIGAGNSGRKALTDHAHQNEISA